MKKTPLQTLTVKDGETREEHLRPLDFSLIRRLWTLTRPHRGRRNLLIVLVVLRSLQITFLVALIPAILRGPVARQSVGGIIGGALLLLLFAAFTQATLFFRMRLGLQLGESIVHDLRNSIFEHLQRLSMDYYNRTKLGRIISRITSDTEAIRAGVQDVFFVSMVMIGQMATATLYMLYYDRFLFLVVLALAPVLYIINQKFRIKLSTATRDVQESFSRITSTLAESVGGIRVTQGYVRQDVNARMFHALITDHSHYNMAVSRTSGAFLPLLDLNNQFFIIAILLLGGWRAMRGATDIEDIVGFILMTGQFFTPVMVLGRLYTQAMRAMAGAERVFRLLDTKPTIVDPPNAIDIPPIRGHIAFRNVSFAYEPDRPVLQNINFIVEPGRTVALVGQTGSGKSSIINLLAKFHLPTSGVITIDGFDMRRIRTDSLHRRMGIVLQQNFIFDGTIMSNIRLGRPDATDADVIAAAETIGCRDLLENLPKGFDTDVGERGGNLALGQRQLVCFARAVLANPQLLFLDEATSSVDALSEQRIQQALEILLRRRTSFVVAHRISTIRNADLVLVMEDGRIIERGTHYSLLDQNGVYTQLYRRYQSIQ